MPGGGCGVLSARRPSGGRFDFVPTLVRSRRCARGAPGAGEAAFETENPLVFAGMYPVLDPIAVLTTCLIGRRSCRSITVRRNKAGLLRSRLSGFGCYAGAATLAVPSLTAQSKGRLSSLMATHQAACGWRAAARHFCGMPGRYRAGGPCALARALRFGGVAAIVLAAAPICATIR